MAQNTIVLKGKLGRRYDEAKMSVAGYPGYLVEFDADDKLKPHATSGGDCIARFLIEDDFQGKTIDDVYAIDSLGRAVTAEPGDIINAVLKAGQTVVRGGPLKSNGDGTLIAQGGTGTIICWAETGLDLAASGVNDFIPVYVK